MKLNMNVLQISGNLFFFRGSATGRILHMAISILGDGAGFNAADVKIPKYGP